ncbi:MAG: polyprenyl synthetase family protein [Pseudomonadota bacterium]|nr:polyprenyl synthetase family protein [Pseudomonadota bacterium]
MNPEVPWHVWAAERQERVERALEQALALGPDAPVILNEAMSYAVLGGGKRVRPLLAYAAGELAGADAAHVDAAAVAVELIHAYSLVHDDLPSMDNDALRRGKPTCHIRFGEATALLAGDALQSLAFAVLGRSSIGHSGEACALLAEMSGALGMAGGQAIDLAAVGKVLSLPELELMHRMKTGALIRACVRLGASCSTPVSADMIAALDAYAFAAGLAFQVVDDVLDVQGTAASLGKTAGKDAAQDKPTFVSVLGFAAARSRAAELRDEACAALSTFGIRARRLTELAEWIVERRH